MSRKQELLKMAKLFRAQANSVSTRAPKKALRKMAEYYQHEAELEGRLAPRGSELARPRPALSPIGCMIEVYLRRSSPRRSARYPNCCRQDLLG